MGFGLAVLCVFHAWLVVAWLNVDSEPLFWDGSEHAHKVVKVQHNLYRSTPPIRGKLLSPAVIDFSIDEPLLARVAFAPLAGMANLVESIYLGAARPPLSYWPSGVLAGWREASTDRIIAAHGLMWFLALIGATYLLGAAFGNRATGFLSAVIVSGYPLFFGQARVPMLDTPLAAATAYSLWAFLRCNEFRDRRWSLVFGAACGAGLLIKQSFPIGLALPLLWVLVPMGREAWLQRGHLSPEFSERLAHLSRALFGCVLVAGPWYLVNTPSTLRFLVKSRMASVAEGDPSSLSLEGLLFYPWVFLDVALGPLFVAAAVGGFVVLLFRGRRQERLTLGLGTLGLLVVFVLLYSNKDARYIAPALPLMAVTTAVAVHRIPLTFVRHLAFGVLICVSAATAIVTPRYAAEFPFEHAPAENVLNSLFDVGSFYAGAPRPGEWPIGLIRDSIRAHSREDVGITQLLVVNGGHLLTPGLGLAGERDRLRLRDGLPVEHVAVHGDHARVLNLAQFYILVERKSGVRERGWPLGDSQLLGHGLTHEHAESLLRVESLPHGGSAELFFYDRSQVDL